VLLLEVALPDRPEAEAGLPELEMDVRRDEAPDVSAPVDETDDVGDAAPGSWVNVKWPSRSRLGMSTNIPLVN
jgi:hypothetical protein